MKIDDLIRKKNEFEMINSRKPTHVALSIEEFHQIKASMYMPGIRGMGLNAFKQGKIQICGMQLIWKENVLC